MKEDFRRVTHCIDLNEKKETTEFDTCSIYRAY